MTIVRFHCQVARLYRKTSLPHQTTFTRRQRAPFKWVPCKTFTRPLCKSPSDPLKECANNVVYKSRIKSSNKIEQHLRADKAAKASRESSPHIAARASNTKARRVPAPAQRRLLKTQEPSCADEAKGRWSWWAQAPANERPENDSQLKSKKQIKKHEKVLKESKNPLLWFNHQERAEIDRIGEPL